MKKEIYIIRKIFIVITFSFFSISCSDDCVFSSITTESLPDAIIEQEYSAAIEYDISCSYTSKFAEIIEGNLPQGIEMDGSGTFSGIPTTEGSFTFKIKLRICFGSGATGATGCSDKTKEFTITVNSE
ncbi:putative Ig domain-containing protein [Bacteroidota bacterium]